MDKIGMTWVTLLSPEKGKVLHQIAKETAHLTGELWDVGCHAGGSTALMALAAPRKHIRMFDSFEGLPSSTEADGQGAKKGTFATDYDETLWILGTVHVGWVPDTFDGLESSRIALAHVDLDLYESTKSALKFILPRVVPGGAVIVDDYGEDWCGVKKAVDEIVAPNPNFSHTFAAPEQIILKRV